MSLKPASGIRSSILQATIANVISFADRLHLNQVGDVAGLVEVGSCDQFSQAFKGLVDVAVKETSRDEHLLFAGVNVLVVIGCAIGVNVDLHTIGAAEHLVVKAIVFVVRSTDRREELLEHRQEKTLFLRQVLQVNLHAEV